MKRTGNRRFTNAVMRTRAAIAAACVIFAGCATPAPAPSLWRMSDIADSHVTTVNLRDAKKNVVGTISPSMGKRVTEVQKRIEAASGVQTAEFFIASGNEPNAFSADTTRGKIVAINIAMLQMLGDDADSYASVLGHEYAHLSLNHTSQRREREQTRRAASNVIGVVLGVVGVPLAGTLASVGTTAVERTYTRDEERDADRLGLDFMVRAGYDPQGAVRVWTKMSEKAQGAGIGFLATHPATEERLRTLSEMARAASESRAVGR